MEKMLPLMMFNEMNKSGSDMGKTMGMAMLMNGGLDFSNMFNGMISNKAEEVDFDEEVK